MRTLFYRILRYADTHLEKVKTRYNTWKITQQLIGCDVKCDELVDYSIASSARIYSEGKLRIGTGLTMGDRAVINSNDSYGIYIGNNLLLASDVYIRSGNHDWSYSDEPFQNRGHCAKKVEFNKEVYSIVIEDNVWISHGATVISGAHIGTGSVIGANAVVGGVIPPYSVVVGNPAQVVSSRKKHLSFDDRQDIGMFP